MKRAKKSLTSLLVEATKKRRRRRKITLNSVRMEVVGKQIDVDLWGNSTGSLTFGEAEKLADWLNGAVAYNRP